MVCLVSAAAVHYQKRSGTNLFLQKGGMQARGQPDLGFWNRVLEGCVLFTPNVFGNRGPSLLICGASFLEVPAREPRLFVLVVAKDGEAVPGQ